MVEFKDRVKIDGTEYAMLKVSTASISKYNVRPTPTKEERTEIAEGLAQSIKEIGLKQLPVCTSKGEIYIGGRRYIAFDINQKDWMAVRIEDATPFEQLIASYSENDQRKNVTYQNEGKLFYNMLELGNDEFRDETREKGSWKKFTQEDLAKKLGKSQSDIQRKIQVYKNLVITEIIPLRSYPDRVTPTLEQAIVVARTTTPKEARPILIKQIVDKKIKNVPTLRKVIDDSRESIELFESAKNEKIQTEVETKHKDNLFTTEIDPNRIIYDLSIAEKAQPKLTKLEIKKGEYGVNTEEEADEYAHKFSGRYLKTLTVFVVEVDLYRYQDETTRQKET